MGFQTAEALTNRVSIGGGGVGEQGSSDLGEEKKRKVQAKERRQFQG